MNALFLDVTLRSAETVIVGKKPSSVEGQGWQVGSV